jgi:hypothetical protein
MKIKKIGPREEMSASSVGYQFKDGELEEKVDANIGEVIERIFEDCEMYGLGYAIIFFIIVFFLAIIF